MVGLFPLPILHGYDNLNSQLITEISLISGEDLRFSERGLTPVVDL